MDDVIAGFPSEMQAGRISRRRLIKTLGLAFAGASMNRRLAAQAGKGFKAILIDHISFEVSDYKRSRDWYVDVLGMTVQHDDGKGTAYLRFGDSVLIVRNGRTRSTPPNVDHIAYRIESWNTDRVKAELDRRGVKNVGAAVGPLRLDVPAPPTNPNYVSYHVADPDGVDLEIAGIAQPGDPQYKAAAASVAVFRQVPRTDGGLRAIFVNHISYSVANYRTTRDFYADLLGMAVTNEDDQQLYLRFGDSVSMVRRASPAHPEAKPGTFDHMGYHIENWQTDHVLEELKRRGVRGTNGRELSAGTSVDGPQENYTHVHVADPDGYDVEICGVAQPGDRLYKKPAV